MNEWRRKFYENYSSTFKREYNEQSYNGYLPYGYHLIKRCFPENKEAKIVDLGCGVGGYLNAVKKAGYKNIEGVDASPEEVAVAHRLGLIEIKQQDLFSYLGKCANDSVDVILLLDVLEHLKKHEVIHFMEEAYRVLTKGGRLVLHVPNAEAIFSGKVRYSDFTHENAFTSKSIAQIATYAGFQSVQAFEDKPLLHSIPSMLRRAIWETMTIPFRLIHAAENGTYKVILSQNLLALLIK